MNKQVEHIVTLTTDLKACLNPIKFGQLEKFGRLEGFKQVAFVL
jgi:hypothetical protein